MTHREISIYSRIGIYRTVSAVSLTPSGSPSHHRERARFERAVLLAGRAGARVVRPLPPSSSSSSSSMLCLPPFRLPVLSRVPSVRPSVLVGHSRKEHNKLLHKCQGISTAVVPSPPWLRRYQSPLVATTTGNGYQCLRLRQQGLV